MTEQQIREDTHTTSAATNGNAGDPTQASESYASTGATRREKTANVAQVAGSAALNAAGTLRERATEIPGGDRSTKAARAVADRVENVANRAMGRQKQGFFERLAGAITNNKFKVAIGAALLAAAGALVTRKSLTEATTQPETELADEA